MSKFYNTLPEEQETTINIDYDNKEIYCYTSRNSVYNRLLKKIGEPTQVFVIKDKITGGKWKCSFSDSKFVKTLLSKTIVIGQCKTELKQKKNK